MRKLALMTVVAAMVAAATAPSAHAVNSIVNWKAAAAPNKAGTKSKPASIGLNLRPFYETLAPDADAPFAWKQVTWSLPKELVLNWKHFPSCPASKVRTPSGRAACRKAEIGKVAGTGFALGLVEPLQVKLYNRPGGTGMVVYVQGDGPVVIDHVFEGIKTKVSGGVYGYALVFSIPDDLQEPQPGAIATVLDFDTRITAKTIKKGKKKIPYIGLTGCPAGGLPFRFQTSNTDGSTHDLVAKAPCK